MDEEAQLKATRQQLLEQASEIAAEVARINTRLQALCPHTWKLHQIAGEGRYCTKCGVYDDDFDD